MALPLDYAPDLPTNTIAHLEAAARSIGLSLRELELLGQDRATAHAFIARALDGEAGEFLGRVSWDCLEQRLSERGRRIYVG